MGRMWSPTDNATLKHYLDTILSEASDQLTEWETNFIDSISTRINNGWNLSQKQEEILERIYAEKTK